jgi:hypothetical protein
MLSRTDSPDPATLARLHAALDGVVEIESLFADMLVPFEAAPRARRVGTLTTELRGIIIELLRKKAV